EASAIVGDVIDDFVRSFVVISLAGVAQRLCSLQYVQEDQLRQPTSGRFEDSRSDCAWRVRGLSNQVETGPVAGINYEAVVPVESTRVLTFLDLSRPGVFQVNHDFGGVRGTIQVSRAAALITMN